MAEQSVPVSGLTCDGCVSTVTEQLASLPGVTSIHVSLVPRGVSTVVVATEREVPDAELQAALSRGGSFTISR